MSAHRLPIGRMCSRWPIRNAHDANGRSGYRPRRCHDRAGTPYGDTDCRARTPVRPPARAVPGGGGRAQQVALWLLGLRGCPRAQNPRSCCPSASHQRIVRGSTIEQRPYSNVNRAKKAGPRWAAVRRVAGSTGAMNLRRCAIVERQAPAHSTKRNLFTFQSPLDESGQITVSHFRGARQVRSIASRSAAIAYPGVFAMMATALLLAAASSTVAAPASRQSLVGTYDGHQMEIAAGLELKADGRFRYGLPYGALDEGAMGKWTMSGDQVPSLAIPSQRRGRSLVTFHQRQCPNQRPYVVARL